MHHSKSSRTNDQQQYLHDKTLHQQKARRHHLTTVRPQALLPHHPLPHSQPEFTSTPAQKHARQEQRLSIAADLATDQALIATMTE